MFKLQQFMTTKDWVQLSILVVVSGALWTWVWIEYKKPIVDPEWYASVTVERQVEAPIN